MIKLKFKLRTLFALTALAALVCLCLVPSEKSPLPSVTIQIVYAPSLYSLPVNSWRKGGYTSFYATLLRRLDDEGKFDLSLSADPM